MKPADPKRRIKVADNSIRKHVMELWRDHSMDTFSISMILRISEARAYNILSERPVKRKPIAYAGKE